MKHQGKQALAWVIAVSAASSVYGGTSFWLKRLASQQSGGHGHDSEEHSGSEEQVAAHENGEHATASEHHDDASGHAEKTTEHAEHAGQESPSQGHDKVPAQDEHGAPKSQAHKIANHDTPHENTAKGHDDHGKDPHATAKAHSKDEHAAPTSHDKPAKELHAAAGHGKEAEKAKDAKPHDANTAPHWSYEKKDPTGPSNWGQLNQQFSQCEKGREQSPIDLKGAVTKASAPHIAWHYNQIAVSVENNGHTIVSSMPNEQNHIMIDDEKYTLAQFHFHNPSEHKIGGIPSDMELHFVHKSASGQLAVIGVMINEKAGNENPFFKPLWSTLPREAHGKSEAKPSLNLAKMLPTHRDYFHYAGSLTTPPCSQGVRWFVLKEPVTMNGSQIELYSSIFGGVTNRPVQPVFGREIIQSSGPAAVAH